MTRSHLEAFCLAILAVACVGSDRSTPNAKALPPSATQTTEDESLLKLAPPLVSQIKKEFAAYRIPTKDDRTGVWASGTHGETPFVASGDFDGNGRIDTALILLGDGDWKLVVFHQMDDGGYRSFPLLTLPNPMSDGSEVQSWVLKVMRKGAERKKEHYDENENNGAVTVVGKYKFPVDVVELIHLDVEDHLYHWTGDKYEDIPFGYE